MDDETNMLYFNLEPPTLDNMTDKPFNGSNSLQKRNYISSQKSNERNKQFKAE